MDRRTRISLAARALGTTAIHATVLVPLGLTASFLYVLMAVVSTTVLASFLPMPTSVSSWIVIGLIVAAAVYGPYSTGSRVLAKVGESRERLLARVVPAELGDELHGGARRLAERGADGGETTEDDVRERLHDLFADSERDGRPTHDDRERFVATTRRLAAQAGVSCPTLGVHPGKTPLCYSVHHGGDTFLVVSRGLLAVLSATELEAVLAHEIAHLSNGDHRFMTWATFPLVAVERVADLGEVDDEEELWSDDLSLGLGRWGLVLVGLLVVAHVAILAAIFGLAGDVTLFLTAVGVVLALLVVVVVAGGVVTVVAAVAILLVAYAYRAALAWAELGTCLFSRGRELAADRAAARLTGDPGALVAALRRLDGSLDEPPPTDLREFAHTRDALNVVPALDPERDGSGGLLATHPRTETRIERLRELEREYERA